MFKDIRNKEIRHRISSLIELKKVSIFLAMDTSALIVHHPDIRVKLSLGKVLYSLIGIVRSVSSRLEKLGFLQPISSIAEAYDDSEKDADGLTYILGLEKLIDAIFEIEKIDTGSLYNCLDSGTVETILHINLKCNIIRKEIILLRARVASGFTFQPLSKHVPSRPARHKTEKNVDIETMINREDKAFTERQLARGFHNGLMATEIATIEATALNIAIERSISDEFYYDMSLQCWDEVRHAEAHLYFLEKLNFDEFSFESDTKIWDMTYSQSLILRLAIHQCIGELIGVSAAHWWSDKFSDQEAISDFFKFIEIDEVQHVEYGFKWINHLAPENEKHKVFARAHEIRDAVMGEALSKKYSVPYQSLSGLRYAVKDLDISAKRF